MKNVTVARRYAKALFEIGVETNSMDDILNGMANIQTALKTAPDLGKVLFNPIITGEEKADIIKSITSNKLILKFVRLLAKRKRLDLLSVVYDQLLLMSDKTKGINRVLVKTAIQLTDDQKNHVESDLAKTLGGKVIGQFSVAKELIGGVWVKMGDKVLDATLRGKFEDLRYTLVHSNN